jgi:DNA-binding response OmpR family regulator
METDLNGTTAEATGATDILMVDDDADLCGMLAEYLRHEGYPVSLAHDGATALQRLRESPSGLVILDITMPGMDGFEVLRRLRQFSAAPVLMLTARGDDVDRIVGLELGADDYLAKPFNPRELVARIRAILRRSVPAGGPERPAARVRRMGDLAIDTVARAVERGGETLALTGAEYTLVEFLTRHAGTVVTKDDLSEQVLGRRRLPFDRSIDTHVSNLRRKLGPGPGGAPRIRSVRGRGYLFVPP